MGKYTDYAQDILAQNDTGEWTVPATSVYPHQWLWDSAFIAMGLATYNPQRAALELTSLLRGQWQNGMMPNMIFSPQAGRPDDSWLWRSKTTNSYAPQSVWTSGVTQPPIVADAVQQVARKLNKNDKAILLDVFVPALIDYHSWLYRERDLTNSGLVTLYHPWETGLDNTPSWQFSNSYVHTPRWLKLIHQTGLDSFLDTARRDINHSDPNDRPSTYDMLRLVHVARSLKRRNYDWQEVARDPHFAAQSVSFNAILIRNNQILRELCQETKTKIPKDLDHAMSKAPAAFNDLFSEDMGEYFHRDITIGQLVPISTISTLVALYSGVIPEDRVVRLIKKLHDPHQFMADFLVPTVPVGSPAFNDSKYWSGPVWLNTNWLIYDGLKRIGLHREATLIRDSSMHLFEKQGAYEYYSPLNGNGHGIPDFSWSAAMYLKFAVDA